MKKDYMSINIHELMKALPRLGNVEIGQGPKNLIASNLKLKEEINTFLNQYPILKNDQSYVDFLEYYCGATVENEDKGLIIDIFGFSDVGTHITEDEGLIIDDEGFLIFAHLIIEGPDISQLYETGFAYDVTNGKEGIYKSQYDGEHSYIWFCETFVEWLLTLIAAEGMLT